MRAADSYGGTVAFAFSGAFVAMNKRMDLVGIVVLGIIVAVGGGTIRDILLNQPIAWVGEPVFVLVAAVSALATIPPLRSGALELIAKFHLISMSDAAGMAMFVVTGTSIALDADASYVAAAIIGVITGVGGGLIRDVLAMQIPGILKSGEFYATAALGGRSSSSSCCSSPSHP